jgi:hypothetical protein
MDQSFGLLFVSRTEVFNAESLLVAAGIHGAEADGDSIHGGVGVDVGMHHV